MKKEKIETVEKKEYIFRVMMNQCHTNLGLTISRFMDNRKANQSRLILPCLSLLSSMRLSLIVISQSQEKTWYFLEC